MGQRGIVLTVRLQHPLADRSKPCWQEAQGTLPHPPQGPVASCACRGGDKGSLLLYFLKQSCSTALSGLFYETS